MLPLCNWVWNIPMVVSPTLIQGRGKYYIHSCLTHRLTVNFNRCHHIDLTVPGADYTCPTSLESLLTFSDPAMGGRRVFSTGNERVPMRLNSRHKYGLDFRDGPFGGVLEIMNENKHPITVYMTMTFEYLPKSTPGYREAQMVSGFVFVYVCKRLNYRRYG